MARGITYQDKGFQAIPSNQLDHLHAIAAQLPDGDAAGKWNGCVRRHFMAAVVAVEEAGKTKVEIQRYLRVAGWGVRKSDVVIACDTAIAILQIVKRPPFDLKVAIENAKAILRSIKTIKGW